MSIGVWVMLTVALPTDGIVVPPQLNSARVVGLAIVMLDT